MAAGDHRRYLCGIITSGERQGNNVPFLSPETPFQTPILFSVALLSDFLPLHYAFPQRGCGNAKQIARYDCRLKWVYKRAKFFNFY